MCVVQANNRPPQKNSRIWNWKFGEQWNGSDKTVGEGRNLREFVMNRVDT